MRGGHAAVARAYILYREEHRRARAERADIGTLETGIPDGTRVFTVIGADGRPAPLDADRLRAVVTEACTGLAGVDPAAVLAATRDNLYDRMSAQQLGLAPITAARSLVETEPDYSRVAARLLADTLRLEALTFLSGEPDPAPAQERAERYPEYFRRFVARGIELGQLDPVLGEFDLHVIGDAMDAERDGAFSFLGLQTLYDRYFLHHQGARYELPQAFFMRVAMGLAIREIDREARAIEFYRLLSSFDFLASTPTLFNAGGPPGRSCPHIRSRQHRPVGRQGVGRREGDDQRPRRCQPAAPGEVALGVGEVPGRLQQPLDADRCPHAGRHRHVKSPDQLTEAERTMLKRNLGFFATAESLVANNIVLAVYRQQLTNPECRQYLLRQAFEEAVHTHTFQ
jgi:Ribonucleotide reductase, all-alpha domain/Ribonucleotide reductase, small chain/ATP cone domain